MVLDKSVVENLDKITRNISESVKGFSEAQTWTRCRTVFLGNGQNPPKVVVPPLERDGVKSLWCYEESIDGKSVFQVANTSGQINLSDDNAGIQVIVGFPPNSSILSVQRVAPETLMQTGGALPSQIDAHLSKIITPSSYQELKVTVDDTGVAKIRVTAGNYRIGDELPYLGDINSTNLASYIPTAPAYFRWVLVLLTKTGNVEITQGEQYPTGTTVATKNQVPRQGTLGRIPLAWVKLTQGMTVLTPSDIIPIHITPYADNLSDSGNGLFHLNFEFTDTPIPYPDADNVQLYAKSDKRLYMQDEDGTEWLLGQGTITSVGLTMPSAIFDVAGSPITEAGTFTVTLDSQLQNLAFASPSGSSGTPAFRALVSADIPSLDASKITGGTFGTTEAIFTTDNAAKVPLKVRGVASQSATLQEWTDSTPTVLAAIGPQGHIGIPTISSRIAINVTKTFADPSAATSGIAASPVFTLSANNAQSLRSLLASGSLNQNGFNLTGTYQGLVSNITVLGASGTVAEAFSAAFGVNNTGGGAITLANGIHIRAFTNTGGGSMANVHAIYIEDQTVGSTDNYAYRAFGGKFVHNENGLATADFRAETDTDTHNIFGQASTNRTGFGTSAPATKVHVVLTDSGTNAVVDVVTIGHNGGSVAAGFGTGLLFQAESSTTNDTSLGRIAYEWTNPTHASRKARGTLTASDTAERTCIQWEASGTAPMVGFYGTAPVARPAAYTVSNATPTRTLDVSTVTLAGLANFVASMIADEQAQGLKQ